MHEKANYRGMNPYTAQSIDSVIINVSREFYMGMLPKYLS